jgi:hypothetical protein
MSRPGFKSELYDLVILSASILYASIILPGRDGLITFLQAEMARLEAPFGLHSQLPWALA